MNLTLTLTAARLIRAPLPQVWLAFAQETGWALWGKDARPEPGLAPLGRPLTVPARLVENRPGRVIRWQVAWRGIRLDRTFRFEAQGEATLISSVEKLSGWTLLLWRPLLQSKKMAQATQQWLGRVAEQAEKISPKSPPPPGPPAGPPHRPAPPRSPA
ncbi:MAG: hypothetical protein KQJ78_18155 [Deltaproteobacteria bacterium]|nr:hypothetical protein [Deltaproteobacteria bacterium]